MRNFLPIFAGLFAYAVAMRVGLCAQKAPTPFSTYGQIQNVQNYSTNPYWNKDSPYNMRMPTPIYATGADLNTGDCNRVVANLIESFCASNNCASKKISDVRPTIMVQLSQLPGHNFATSCGGYIDSEFENYKRSYGNVSTNTIVKPAVKSTTNNAQYGNMFAKTPSAYEQGVAERTAELKQLQSATTATPTVTASAFPASAADLSFTERMANNAKGYEPFKDMKAYRGLVVEGEEHFIERQLALLTLQSGEDAKNMSKTEYCKKYSLDDARCGTVTGIDCKNAVGTTVSENCGGVSVPNETPVGSGGAGASASNNDVVIGKTIGGTKVIPNNKVRGGSCYPAAKSKKYRNDILTSGQYETIAPPFEKALITLFRKEGGCGEIPNDPCGYTCYGLGSGPKCMNMDVSKLTRKDAETVYYERFWKKYKFDKLPDVVSGDLFLASVGAGVCTSIQQFRQFLGLGKNCSIDDDLVAAVENYPGDIHNDWLDVRREFLLDVASRRYANSVKNGWMNSIQIQRENGCHTIPAEPLYRE